MKKVIVLLTVVLSAGIYASGPSYEAYIQDVKGLASAETEVKACAKARKEAIAEVTYSDHYGYERVECETEEPARESVCTCDRSRDKKMASCLYEAKITCYEEVWYN